MECELGEQVVGCAGTGKRLAGRGGTNEEGVQHSEERITRKAAGTFVVSLSNGRTWFGQDGQNALATTTVSADYGYALVTSNWSFDTCIGFVENEVDECLSA